MQKQKLSKVILLAVMLLVLPALYLTGGVSITTLTLLSRYLCFAIAALGVDLIWGYTGIMSMCQAFFFCLGAYGVGMYMTLANLPAGTLIPDFMRWSDVEQLPLFWQPFSTFGGMLVACLLATIGFASLSYFIFRRRIKGVFIAIITQAIAWALFLFFSRNETLLGGSNGLTNFQTLLGFDLRSDEVKLGLYVLTVIVLWGCYEGCKMLVGSKFGKVLQSIKTGESRLRFTGYHVSHYQTAIFVIGAVLAMIGGMLYLPQTGIVTPGRMDVKASIEMLIWVALGGRGSLKGAILGALVVNMMYSFFTSLMPEAWPYVLGLLYVLTVLYFNKGVMGLLEQVDLRFLKKIVVSKVEA